MALSESEAFGATSLVVTQSVVAFATFLPHLTDVRRCNPATNPEEAADVRMGETASVILILGIGSLAAHLTGELLPLYSGIFISGLLVLVYEWTLRGQRFSRKPHPMYGG